MSEGPRIYNLFPRLLGKIPQWKSYLAGIAEMKFNWIYLNPVNDVGFSGSLYSIKDFFTVNPLFAVDTEDQHSWDSLKHFIEEAHKLNLRVMMDLVINHTAVDMVEEHPNWYVKKFAIVNTKTDAVIRFIEPGERHPDPKRLEADTALEYRVANPYAIDPADARNITIWGDLAEIDYNNPKLKPELLTYWKKLLDLYLEVGFDGFRCDAAYQVPEEIWNELISYTRKIKSDCLFWAETLGCSIHQCAEIADEFDYIASSSKYWDYSADWCVWQYNEFGKLAPSISFPESHDTPRLYEESGGREDIQKFKYFFAAFFSAGVMIPIGYEHGFKTKIDVVQMGPKDWELPNIDISEFISLVNQFKSEIRCLNEDGLIVHHHYSNRGILVISKFSKKKDQQLLLVYNKDWHTSQVFEYKNFPSLFEREAPISILSLDGFKQVVTEQTINIVLKPNQYLMFFQE